MTKPRLHNVICSTRPGRAGPCRGALVRPARTRAGQVRACLGRGRFNLPIYDEPLHPIFRQYQHEHTKRWSASVASADALAFVTPESIHPPPAFVNALDYVSHEWNYKPCGFVSYGGASGGLRAVQVEKQLVTTLKMMPMVEGVAIPGIADLLTEGRPLKDAASIAIAAMALPEEFLKWTTALRALRERPSVASQSDLTAEHVRTPAADVRAERTRAVIR